MVDAVDLVWFNGNLVAREEANPSVASYSLHLGIAVFDGIRAFWNIDHYYVHALREHLDRLCENATTLEMVVPFSIGSLELRIKSLLAALPSSDYYLRPIIYRTHPTFFISNRHQMPVDVAVLATVAPRGTTKALRCHVSPIERLSSKAIPVSAKISGSYVNTYLARAAAEAAGFDEGIMLDKQRRVAEAAAANLFFTHGNALITPQLTSDIFPGITRVTLMKLAKTLDIEVIERHVYPQELGRFEAAFSCATLSEIKPISQIDHHTYDTPSNHIYKNLTAAYQDVMSS